MSTDEMISRLTQHGTLTFWPTPSGTRIGIEFVPRDGSERIGRFGSDTADINAPLFAIYDAYVQALIARTKEVRS